MQRIVLPLLLLIAFISESVYSSVVSTNLFGENSITVPHFLVIVLLFITVYYNTVQGIYLAILFGFLFDIVYTELVGIYLFAYPILAYFVSNAMKILQVNLFIVSVLILVGVIALEYYVYGLLLLIGRANLSGAEFVLDRLFPTLILNSLFLILFCFPLKKYLLKLLALTEEK